MSNVDQLKRFMLPDHNIRGEIVQLEQSYATIISRHDYPLCIQEHLGELAAAASLLAATIKFEGNLIIQARGNGALSAIQIECTNDYKLRGIARWQGQLPDQSIPLKTLLGHGQLAITILPKKGERYQGIVPLEGNSLAEFIETYFAQSEQLRTRIWLGTGDGKAAGFLIQELPNQELTQSETDNIQPDWGHIEQLTQTIKPEELLSLDHDVLLNRFYHQETLRIYEPDPVCFECSCSKQRTAEAIKSMGSGEIEALLEEGQAEVRCQFCNQTYHFDAVDLQNMLKGNYPTGNEAGAQPVTNNSSNTKKPH